MIKYSYQLSICWFMILKLRTHLISSWMLKIEVNPQRHLLDTPSITRNDTIDLILLWNLRELDDSSDEKIDSISAWLLNDNLINNLINNRRSCTTINVIFRLVEAVRQSRRKNFHCKDRRIFTIFFNIVYWCFLSEDRTGRESFILR